MWPGLNDTVQLPKIGSLLVGVAVLLGLETVRIGIAGSTDLPRAPVVYAATVFAAALVIATLLAPHGWLAVIGSYGRWTGAVPYLAYVTLPLVVARIHTQRTVGQLVGAIVAAAGVVALYGIVEWLGADNGQSSGRFGDAITSRLGNPNFAGAYLGSVTPLIAWLGLSTRTAWVRAGATASGVAALLAIWATGTLQGPMTAAIALGALSVAWLLTQSRGLRRWGLASIGAILVAGAMAILLSGGLPQLVESGNLDLRGHYWTAGGRMVADQPLLGVGMDHYEAYYRRYTPEAAVARLGAENTADQPHSVPLAMFVSGGLLLGLSYVAVILATGWALVHAWRRARTSGDRDDRLLVGALAGAWLAYQAQALISIDVPSLGTLHWLLVGAIVVVCEPSTWQLSLPWQPPRKGRRGRAHRRTATLAGALVAVLLLALAVVPLVADSAARAGRTADEPERVAAHFDRATGLIPGEGRYWFLRGSTLAQQGRFPAALASFETGAERAPWHLELTMSAARTAVQLEDAERALRWYERSLELEPQGPGIKVEVAEFLAEVGEVDRARQLVSKALAVDPDHAEGQALQERL